MRKTEIGILLAVGLVVAGGVAVYLMELTRRPADYTVQAPASREEREAMIAKQGAEIAKWSKHGHGIDPDEGYPLYRAQLVKAIEQYYLNNGKFPPDVKTLSEAGLTTEPKIEEMLKIVLIAGGWEIHAGSYVIAKGD